MSKMATVGATLVLGLLVMGCGNPENGDRASDYSSVKIAPPETGMYLGQYEWSPGDVLAFEEVVGRKTAMFGYDMPLAMEWDDEGYAFFNVEAAQKAWDEGKVVLVHALEADPNPLVGLEGELPVGFTIDKLLNGDYEDHLRTLATQFRQFGKPMFFMTSREPNGLGEEYLGGFGPDGDKSTEWALANEKGLAEFDPSKFPNPELYADLGDPNVSDGVERVTAAQRYYYDFFVSREGLEFLTFDSVGWATADTWEERVEARGLTPSDPGYQLIKTSFGFEHFYPGDEYVDWVSITFYIVDWWDRSEVIGRSIERLAVTMSEIRKVASGKPVLIIEMGYPAETQDSGWAAEKVTAGMSELISAYPEVRGFVMWSNSADLSSDGFDYLIRPNTAQARAFREVVDANPAYFHSCVYFSDGSRMPTCEQ